MTYLTRLAAVLTAAGSLFTVPAHAGLVVNVQSVAVSANSTNNALDVTLTNTGPGAITLGAFAYELSTVSSSINFTAVLENTAAPYVYAGNSLLGPDISYLTGQSVRAGDVPDVGVGTVIAAGGTVGIGHVIFDVGAISGPFTVALTPYPQTSFADNVPNNLSFTGVDGTITVGSSAVPEPSSALLLLGALPLAVWRLRQRS